MPPLQHQSDPALLKAIEQFQELIAAVVPRTFEPPLQWQAVATAFMARFSDQLDSVAILIRSGHYTDALIVLRATFESAVMFCWISAEPESRFVKWMENSIRGRAVAIGEAQRDFGLEPREGEDLDREQSLDRLDGLQNMARVADDHWGELLPAFRRRTKDSSGLLTLSGLYTATYRPISRVAHGEVESVDPVLKPDPSQVVITSEKQTGRRPEALGLCIPIVAFALVVYEHQFGELDSAAITRISQLMGSAL